MPLKSMPCLNPSRALGGVDLVAARTPEFCALPKEVHQPGGQVEAGPCRCCCQPVTHWKGPLGLLRREFRFRPTSFSHFLLCRGEEPRYPSGA